jgi:hypothetical protein
MKGKRADPRRAPKKKGARCTHLEDGLGVHI